MTVKWLPWGKYDDESSASHRLEHHCADVAACFETLLDDSVLRNRFANAVGWADLDHVTRTRLAVLAFFHDFGKLNTGFQFQVVEGRSGAPKKADHLKAALWACKHDRVLGALGLPELAASWGLDGLEQLLAATLAHHGRPARLPNTSGKGPPDIWQPFAEYDPLETARRLNKLSREWFPRTGGDRPEADDAPIAPRMAPPHGRG